jgi:hypothetical protein
VTETRRSARDDRISRHDRHQPYDEAKRDGAKRGLIMVPGDVRRDNRAACEANQSIEVVLSGNGIHASDCPEADRKAGVPGARTGRATGGRQTGRMKRGRRRPIKAAPDCRKSLSPFHMTLYFRARQP